MLCFLSVYPSLYGITQDERVFIWASVQNRGRSEFLTGDSDGSNWTMKGLTIFSLPVELVLPRKKHVATCIFPDSSDSQ